MKHFTKFIWLAMVPIFVAGCSKTSDDPTPPITKDTAVITVINGTGGGTIKIGNRTTIEAIIPSGQTFNYWESEGQNVSSDNPYTFVVTKDATYEAKFKSDAVLTVVNGTGGGTFAVGSSVTVTATPGQGETFKHWTIGGDVVSTQSTYTFTLTGNTTITAVMKSSGGDYVLDYTKTLKMTGSSFKVLNLTDIQLCDEDTTLISEHVIDTLVERVKPDLITYLGDILHDSKTSDSKIKPFDVIKHIDSKNIPWAPIFGNHDTLEYGGAATSQRTVGVKELMATFASCKNCLFTKGPSEVLGDSNYVIDIVDSTNKHVESLIMFDSFTSGLQESHVTFYKDIVASLKTRNNNVTVPTVLLDHIPLPQYTNANANSEACEFRDVVGCGYGHILSAGTEDLFPQIKSLGSTKTVICGHDHENAYYTTYEGVKLAYAMKSAEGDDEAGTNFKHGLGGLVLTIDGQNEDQLQYEKVEDLGYTFGTGCEVSKGYDFHPDTLGYWRYSGAKLKFEIDVPDNGKISLNIEGTNLFGKDKPLGAWNRLTGNSTIEIKSGAVTVDNGGTMKQVSGNTYAYELDVSKISLNGTSGEQSYGDETARIVYFCNITGVFTVRNVRYEFEEITEIDQKDLATAVVADIADQDYNKGLPIKPQPTVTVSGTTLKPIDDILYTYKNNTEAGTATVTIVPSGKGAHKYKGFISKTFEIVIPSRGVLRTGGTPIDFKEINVSKGGTLTIDYRYVDPVADKENGVSFYLGTDGYTDNCFGKYKIFHDRLEADFAGITFSTCSDGYFRMTIDVTKLTNVPSGLSKPTKITRIIFRYFEAQSGIYFDINSEPIEDPARGDAFTAGVNTNIDFATPLALTDTLTIDFKITTAEGTKANIMFGDGWYNYLGYYAIYANTKTGDYPGVTVTALSDGYLHCEFNFTTMLTNTQKVSGSPQKINLFHIRGGWTDASGYYELNPKSTSFKMTGSEFKVCNFTDIHVDNVTQLDLANPVGKTINYAMTNTKPDLVTFSGDFAWNTTHLNALCAFMDGYEVPYFFTLGNHDRQGMTTDQIVECVKKSKYGYFTVGPNGLNSEGNYIVEIQNASGELVHGLVMMDSGDKTTVEDSLVEYVGTPVSGVKYGSYKSQKTYCDAAGWTGIRGNQLTWYENTVDALNCETSLITHMPFVEYTKAYEEYQKALQSGDQSKVDACAPVGNCTQDEACCGPIENFGLFARILEHGSTKNVICGHDHKNDFSLLYQGVRLTYALKTGNGYYWEETGNRSGYTTLTINSTGKTSLTQNYFNPLN